MVVLLVATANVALPVAVGVVVPMLWTGGAGIELLRSAEGLPDDARSAPLRGIVPVNDLRQCPVRTVPVDSLNPGTTLAIVLPFRHDAPGLGGGIGGMQDRRGGAARPGGGDGGSHERQPHVNGPRQRLSLHQGPRSKLAETTCCPTRCAFSGPESMRLLTKATPSSRRSFLTC